ncbi:decarboxylase [Candidatus Woesearchaeota archaeon]|jgi:ornithine decarboxylase|nr:decarboxylase [Candidatus Woesearchaeota archaeon]
MSEPKFLLSKTKVLEQYNKVKQLASFISYSSKTNQEVTKILDDETNCFFSVHLINELKHLKDNSRVIFLAQGWTNNSIKKLIKQGIKYFIVDNEPDLETLMNYLEKNKNQINLFLRLKLKEHTLKTERYFVFGMDSETINKKLKELKNHSQIKNLGIHFHRKTQNMSEWNLKDEIASTIEKENLEAIDIMNIGGGLPADYANTNVEIIKSIFNKIKEFKEWLEKYNIKLVIEPGRFIAAPSCRLKTNIINIYKQNIVINASIYNSDIDALIVPVKLLVENERKQGIPYVIKGITPCSMDLFRYRVYLDNPQIGDEIIFLNAGAYNFSTDFCDLEKIDTKILT